MDSINTLNGYALCDSEARALIREISEMHADNIVEPSYNLLNENKIVWNFEGTYTLLENGYYFPVDSGTVIVCNIQKTFYDFFDANKVQIASGISSVMPYKGAVVPDNAKWCRVRWNTSNSGLTYKQPVMVYATESASYAEDDRRIYVPSEKIRGRLVEGDIYETAIPQTLDVDVLTMSKLLAVREINKQRNGIRIGTFNIYVSRTQYHWPVLKKELQDCAIDICGFQEVKNTDTRKLTAFLTKNNWLYQYGSAPDLVISNNVFASQAVASAYPTVSSELIRLDDERQCVKCVVNLPKYKTYSHQFTLSIYSCHLSLTKSKRLAEVDTLLNTIANDSSDFVVIVGDMNEDNTSADEHGKLPTWEAIISGGFTPITYDGPPSFPGSGQFIDQIFMGENVSCAYYDVVDSSDYLVKINGQDLPISDHNLVYADIIFDYDAVLATL